MIETGKYLADVGMQAALHHANRVNDNWGEQAYDLFKEFITSTDQPFKTEDARKYAESKELPPAPKLCAWGAITRRMHREGLIKAVGVSRCELQKSRHNGYTTNWIKTEIN